MNRTEKAGRRYFGELIGVMCLFAILLVARNRVPAGDLKIGLRVATLIPIWLLAFVVLRLFLATDEYGRQQMVKTFAIGAAATALATISYAHLQPLGLPDLSIMWTWPIMGGICGLCGLTYGWRDYASKHGTSPAMKQSVLLVGIVAGPTALYALVATLLKLPLDAGILFLVATAIFVAISGYYLVFKCQAE